MLNTFQLVVAAWKYNQAPSTTPAEWFLMTIQPINKMAEKDPGMKKFRNPENIHKPLGGYSHQVEITGSERMLILSGQVGMRPDGTFPKTHRTTGHCI